MAHLEFKGVCVDFPVFSSQARGLINSIVRFDKFRQDRIEIQRGSGLQVHALRDVDLHLTSGDRVGLIGSNGAGKTTLLRVMSGVYEPLRGSIVAQGSISALTDLLLGIDPEASGYDFIVTRGIVMGLSKERSRGLFADIEEFTELGDYLHLPIRSYSSGMLLRLSFAVATAVAPDILLMDEMIGVGDSRFLDRARARLQKLMERVQILVLASHNEEVLRTFCDKGIVMGQGRILMTGSIGECLAFHAARSGQEH